MLYSDSDTLLDTVFDNINISDALQVISSMFCVHFLLFAVSKSKSI